MEINRKMRVAKKKEKVKSVGAEERERGGESERDRKSDRESFKGNKVKKTKEIRSLGYRERVNYIQTK